MASLDIAKISYTKWLRFTILLIILWLLAGLVFVIYAHPEFGYQAMLCTIEILAHTGYDILTQPDLLNKI